MPLLPLLLQVADTAAATPEPARRSGVAFWSAIGAVFIIAFAARRRRRAAGTDGEGQQR